MSQLTPFEVGQIKAHLHHELGPAEISRIVLKKDGKSRFSDTAIADAIAKLMSNPAWRGDRKKGSGARRATTKKQDRALVKFVEDNRGKMKVTVSLLRSRFPWLKPFGNTMIEERLHEADLRWLRRRRKTLVEKQHLQARIAYCEMVMRKHQATLDKWAFTDGTVFYLDKTASENEHTQRRALGPYVWRRSDSREALTMDCVGPSSYKKAQGAPVRIWGLLAEGALHVHVLPQHVVMDRFEYAEVIEDRFPDWLGSCSYLVQDFETCLRCDEPLEAMRMIGVQLVEEYPRVSQDFNAIENVWALLRERLDDTLPPGIESREAFVARLRAAVAWLNKKRKGDLIYFSRNQKERARDCLAATPKGARTKW